MRTVMKNYLSIPILGLLVCGCSVTGSLQRRHAGAALAHTPKVMRHEARREQAPPQYIEIRHTDGRPTEFFVPAVTLENGEQVMMMELDEVVVTARTRSLPERMGKVDIDFVVTLPKMLQGSCRNIVVTPVLHNRGERTPLEDISVRGALFDKVQERDYWQYGRYIDLYRPDSLRAQEAFDRFVRFPYPQDVRCDSVRASRSAISYYYTQTVPTADAGKRLSVTLEGRVEGLDGSLYLLPPSDTLSYTISSMLNFVDTTTRYLTRIIERRVRLDDRVLLTFPVGSAAIVDTLSGNAAQLMKTGVVLERLFGQREFTVDSISVTAFASPEGGAAMNLDLSRRRAQALGNYLKERFPDAGLDTLVAVRSAGEDWIRLGEMVHGDSLIRNRERILELIDTEPNPDRRERLIRERYGEDYARIRKEIYPKLRAVELRYYLQRVGMTKDTVHTTEIDTLYLRGRRLLEERNYRAAVGILLPYADRNAAIALLSLGKDERALDVLYGLPEDGRSLYLRAIALARLERKDEALEAFARACAFDPNLEYRAGLDPELNELVKK